MLLPDTLYIDCVRRQYHGAPIHTDRQTDTPTYRQSH